MSITETVIRMEMSDTDKYIDMLALDGILNRLVRGDVNYLVRYNNSFITYEKVTDSGTGLYYTKGDADLILDMVRHSDIDQLDHFKAEAVKCYIPQEGFI